MIRLVLALLLVLPSTPGWPQAFDSQAFDSREPDIAQFSDTDVTELNIRDRSDLPDAPSALHLEPSPEWKRNELIAPRFDPNQGFLSIEGKTAFHTWPPPSEGVGEPYHWKGLLLQSFAFNSLENAVRIMSANQTDRHTLLNKPYWSDYWASLQQFNMRRWNDGDSFLVNYVGHPLQGAVAGYIEIQNDPRSHGLYISRNPRYWRSVFRAFLWATVYSTQSEIGPTGEAAIFNEGGFTYPIGCPGDKPECTATAKYTNNTGWVDFIITPTVGMLWMLGEDTADRFISDPLVHRYPSTFGYKMLRAGLNPARSLANMLRGHYPWLRDEEHPELVQSIAITQMQRTFDEKPTEAGDLYIHYNSYSLGTNTSTCTDCRNQVIGTGMQLGISIRKYLDFVADIGGHPNASLLSSLNVGGSLLTANFGIRSGYSGQRFALKVSLAPGFASYSRAQPLPTESNPNPEVQRNFNFSAVAALAADLRFTQHFAVRGTVEQMLIRYKSTIRDPPGIGKPPRLSFLSHDNYINSTNWGVTVGPVFRF